MKLKGLDVMKVLSLVVFCYDGESLRAGENINSVKIRHSAQQAGGPSGTASMTKCHQPVLSSTNRHMPAD